MNGRMNITMAVLIFALVGCTPVGKKNIHLPGRSTTVAKCSACHLAPEAYSMNPRSLVEVMTSHAKRVRLTADQLENIRLFLLADENQHVTTGYHLRWHGDPDAKTKMDSAAASDSLIYLGMC